MGRDLTNLAESCENWLQLCNINGNFSPVIVQWNTPYPPKYERVLKQKVEVKEGFDFDACVKESLTQLLYRIEKLCFFGTEKDEWVGLDTFLEKEGSVTRLNSNSATDVPNALYSKIFDDVALNYGWPGAALMSTRTLSDINKVTFSKRSGPGSDLVFFDGVEYSIDYLPSPFCKKNVMYLGEINPMTVGFTILEPFTLGDPDSNGNSEISVTCYFRCHAPKKIHKLEWVGGL
jgi:hypothetical protein